MSEYKLNKELQLELNKYKQLNNKINLLHKCGIKIGNIRKILNISYQHANNEIDRFATIKKPREKLDMQFINKYNNKNK